MVRILVSPTYCPPSDEGRRTSAGGKRKGVPEGVRVYIYLYRWDANNLTIQLYGDTCARLVLGKGSHQIRSRYRKEKEEKYIYMNRAMKAGIGVVLVIQMGKAQWLIRETKGTLKWFSG